MSEPKELLLETAEELLPEAWCRETASPGCQAAWTPENPSWGQCAVTALLIQELFGGQLIRTVIEGFGSHYYNKLDGERYVDVTKGQFPEGTDIPPGKLVDRGYVLSSERAVEARTAERYALLAQRFLDASLRKLGGQYRP